MKLRPVNVSTAKRVPGRGGGTVSTGIFRPKALEEGEMHARDGPEETMKPAPGPCVLPFRLLPPAAALFLISVLFPGTAGAEWGLEITPYAGYAIGGGFEDNATGADLKVKEGSHFGLVLDLSEIPETKYELFYGFQQTKVTGGEPFGGNTLFDMDIHYLHAGGNYVYDGDRVRPFVAAGLGATHFVPHGSGLNRKTYLSFSLGGGATIPISGRVGLRFEGRAFLTILPDATEVFCASSGGAACRVSVKGDAFGQVLLMTGITFSSCPGCGRERPGVRRPRGD